jgi:hypothetical protein
MRHAETWRALPVAHVVSTLSCVHYTQSIAVRQSNLLSISSLHLALYIPPRSLPPTGNMSFTAVELTGWVHDPNAFDSDSSYDINQEGNCIPIARGEEDVRGREGEAKKKITVTSAKCVRQSFQSIPWTQPFKPSSTVSLSNSPPGGMKHQTRQI